MKVLFLCGVFAQENEKEIIAHSKRPVEYSANIFQEKLINGFREIGADLRVVSAPFIGSYPNASDIRSFNGFADEQEKYEYVKFCNIWGLRNFSRAASLKKALRSFAAEKDSDKLIVVYSPHTPFLEAAVNAKKKDPTIKICLVIPDLPQFMNLNEKKSALYTVGKKFDINKFNKLNLSVDSYALLTEAMTEKINVHSKPYTIVEGIVTNDDIAFSKQMRQKTQKSGSEKFFVYTGKLNVRFGVKTLVDAFVRLKDENYRLVLCGCGDAEEYIAEKCKEDSRIMFLGQVTPAVAREWMYKADVLVNPRTNNEEYTRYSFPSKNIEYLLTGNTVVSYKLDGMPDFYKDFIEIIPDGGDEVEVLAQALQKAVMFDGNEGKYEAFIKYAAEKRCSSQIANEIISL